MNYKRNLLTAAFGLSLFLNQAVLKAQDDSEPRFSHTGVKVSLGSASFDMIGERGLQDGDGGMVSIGYGFTQRFSLWLSFVGSEHQLKGNVKGQELANFSGIELNLQHRFEADARFQPYGKVGIGVYGLEMDNSPNTLVGAGINLGFGVDYFFSKHFGVGAELMWKKLDYITETHETPEGDVFKAVEPHLNGDTTAFMLTFTIQ